MASGDYKREFDPTCEPFEPVPCDVFVTEATFGTPAYQWKKDADLGREIFDWWEKNRKRGTNSVLCAYSLGKTQRVLGLLNNLTDRAAYLDPAAAALTDCYRAEGVRLLPTIDIANLGKEARLKGELIIAPHSFLSGPNAVFLGNEFETAFASGWMAQNQGYGVASAYDRGFTMSDHADWNDLLRTIRETGAKRVYVQHRGPGALVRHLNSLGLEAFPEEELAKTPASQLSLF